MSAFNPTSPRPLGGSIVAWEHAFSDAEVDRIVALGDSRPRERAEMAAIEDPLGQKRVTDVSWFVRDPEAAWLFPRLEQVVQRLNIQYYKYDVFPELHERLQYTVYESSTGGHYGWHVDQGARTRYARKLSLSLQLSASSDYEGCDLEFEFGDGIVRGPRSRGAVVVFSSYVLHRVTPITSGVRKSLVAWVSGPEFK
jgi:PKHD-type hydroxylase